MDASKKRKNEENGVQSDEDEEDLSLKLTPQDVRRLIEPFTHEQMAEIVQKAATRHVDVLDDVRSIIDLDSSQRKLFIRGLGWETTSDKLISVFSAHGEIEEAIVITDKATGKSRGYGFITFKHVDGAFLSLKEPSKRIDGRMTVTQLAASGITSSAASTQTIVDVTNRKIYVANVPSDMPPDILLSHFSTYGEIEEGPLGFDKQTGKSRGFALFVFKTKEAAHAALVNPVKSVDGHQLVCKMAMGKPVVGQVITPALGQIPIPIGDPALIHAPSATRYAMPLQTGISAYSGYGGSLQGPLSLSHHQIQASSLGSTPVLPPSSAPMQSTYGGGFGGSYGGTQFGIPGGGGSVGGVGGNTGSSINPSGSSMLSSSGVGISSLYSRLPTSGVLNHSSHGGETGHYSLSSSSAYSSGYGQAGVSPVPRVPQSGLYQGMPHYF